MRFSVVVALVAISAFVVAACGAATPAAITPTASLVVGPTAAVSSFVATPSSASTIIVTTPSGAPTPAAPPPTLAPTQIPSATAVAVVDLCALLSALDLQTVLGGNWYEGQLTSTGGYCHWDSGIVPSDQAITAIDERSIEEVKSATPGGVDMTVSGHAGYSVRDENYHLQTSYVDLGGQSLIVEFPISSSAADDQISAQELAEIAIGNI